MLQDLIQRISDNVNVSSYLRSFWPPIVWSVLLTLFGAAIVSLLQLWRQRFLVALVPAIGFAAVVLFWSNVGLVSGSRQPELLIGCGILSVWLISRSRERQLRELVPLCAGFLAVAAVGLLPNLRVLDSSVLNHPTTNHDAFYYASNQAWVGSEPYSRMPQITTDAATSHDPPAFSSALVAGNFNVRQGEGLVAAFLEPAAPSSVNESWYPSRVTWLFVSFSLVYSAGILLGLRRFHAWVAAIVAVASWQPLFQVLNQNSPAVVGVGFVPLFAALGNAFRRQLHSERLILVSAAVSAATLMAVYSELLPFGFLAFLLFACSGAFVKVRTYLSLGLAGLLALALAPYSSMQAIKTNVRVGGLVNSLGASLYWDQPLEDVLRNLLGINERFLASSALLLIPVVITLVGLLLTTWKLRTPAASIIVVIWLVLLVRLGNAGATYSLDRLVQTMFGPIVWLSAVGFLKQTNRIKLTDQSRRVGLVRPGVLLVILGGTVLVPPLGFLSSQDPLDWRATDRSLDNFMLQAARVAGDGTELMIHTNRYVDRLWTSVAVRDFRRTEFAMLTPDYFVNTTEFDDRTADRYLVTNLPVPGADNVVSSGPAGFRLLDMAGSRAGLLVPIGQRSNQLLEGDLELDGIQPFKLMVWSTSNTAEVTIRFSGPAEVVWLRSPSLTRVNLVRIGKDQFRLRIGTGSHVITPVLRGASSEGKWTVTLESIATRLSSSSNE